VQSIKFCKDFIKARELPILSLRAMQHGLFIYDMWNKSTVMMSEIQEIDW